MTDILKGNFATAKKVEVSNKAETDEDRFEMEAKKKLGGSIAYVSKKRVNWDTEKSDK